MNKLPLIFILLFVSRIVRAGYGSSYGYDQGNDGYMGGGGDILSWLFWMAVVIGGLYWLRNQWYLLSIESKNKYISNTKTVAIVIVVLLVGAVVNKATKNSFKQDTPVQPAVESTQFMFDPTSAVPVEATSQYAEAIPPKTKPSTLTCGRASGNSGNGLNTYGASSFEFNGNNPVNTKLTWGVSYSNPNLRNDSVTGSLKAKVYLFKNAYSGASSGASLEGFIIGEYVPNFEGDGTWENNHLKNNYNATDIISTDQKTISVPSGSYCAVVFLEEYNSKSCKATDHFCVEAWSQFPDQITF